MKYKLRQHGWEFSMSGYSLNDDELDIINDLIEDGEYESIEDMGFALEDIIDGYYAYDGNLFSVNSKSTDSSGTTFVVEDENGTEILEFQLEDMADLYEVLGDDWDNDEYRGADGSIVPTEEHKNILVFLEENKGHICNFYFESDDVPTAQDFTWIGGSIETEDGDWDFVDKVMFRKQILEPEFDESYLNGKNLEFKINSYEE